MCYFIAIARKNSSKTKGDIKMQKKFFKVGDMVKFVGNNTGYSWFVEGRGRCDWKDFYGIVTEDSRGEGGGFSADIKIYDRNTNEQVTFLDNHMKPWAILNSDLDYDDIKVPVAPIPKARAKTWSALLFSISNGTTVDIGFYSDLKQEPVWYSSDTISILMNDGNEIKYRLSRDICVRVMSA